MIASRMGDSIAWVIALDCGLRRLPRYMRVRYHSELTRMLSGDPEQCEDRQGATHNIHLICTSLTLWHLSYTEGDAPANFVAACLWQRSDGSVL